MTRLGAAHHFHLFFFSFYFFYFIFFVDDSTDCCLPFSFPGLFVLLAGRRGASAAESRTGDRPFRQRGRHLPFQQPIPDATAVVRARSRRGGPLLRPQQFRLHHLHRLLHQLPQVGSHCLDFFLSSSLSVVSWMEKLATITITNAIQPGISSLLYLPSSQPPTTPRMITNHPSIYPSIQSIQSINSNFLDLFSFGSPPLCSAARFLSWDDATTPHFLSLDTTG